MAVPAPRSTALLLSSILLAAQTAPHRLRELVAQAQAAEQQNQLDKAVDLYKQILRIRPGWASAELNLGLVHHSRGDWTEAIRMLTQALQHDGKLLSAYLFRGASWFHTGRFDDAVRDLGTYIRHEPADTEALSYLANAQSALGNTEEAALAYAAIVRIKGGSAAHFQLSEACAQLARRFLQSLSAAERGKLLTSGADDPCPGGCSDAFEAEIRKLMALAGDARNSYRLAQGYRRLANAAIAKIVPESAWGHLVRAQAADLANDPEVAQKAFEQAMTAPEAGVEVLLRYGQFECKHGRFDRGLSLYQKARALEPANGRIDGLIGEAHTLADRPDQAIPFLARALKANPREMQARLYLAQSLNRLNRRAEAVKVLEAAPEDPEGRIHYVLGRTYQQLGLTDKARAALRIYRERHARVTQQR